MLSDVVPNGVRLDLKVGQQKAERLFYRPRGLPSKWEEVESNHPVSFNRRCNPSRRLALFLG